MPEAVQPGARSRVVLCDPTAEAVQVVGVDVRGPPPGLQGLPQAIAENPQHVVADPLELRLGLTRRQLVDDGARRADDATQAFLGGPVSALRRRHVLDPVLELLVRSLQPPRHGIEGPGQHGELLPGGLGDPSAEFARTDGARGLGELGERAGEAGGHPPRQRGGHHEDQGAQDDEQAERGARRSQDKTRGVGRRHDPRRRLHAGDRTQPTLPIRGSVRDGPLAHGTQIDGKGLDRPDQVRPHVPRFVGEVEGRGDTDQPRDRRLGRAVRVERDPPHQVADDALAVGGAYGGGGRHEGLRPAWRRGGRPPRPRRPARHPPPGHAPTGRRPGSRPPGRGRAGPCRPTAPRGLRRPRSPGALPRSGRAGGTRVPGTAGTSGRSRASGPAPGGDRSIPGASRRAGGPLRKGVHRPPPSRRSARPGRRLRHRR